MAAYCPFGEGGGSGRGGRLRGSLLWACRPVVRVRQQCVGGLSSADARAGAKGNARMSQGYPPPPSPGGPPLPPWATPKPFGSGPPQLPPTTPYGFPGVSQPPGPQIPGPLPVGPPPPDNYLVWAILATVFCCFLGGIPALMAATSVNERWLGGDHAGAREASLRARNWTIGAVLLGVIFWTGWMVGVFVLGWKDTLGDL